MFRLTIQRGGGLTSPTVGTVITGARLGHSPMTDQSSPIRMKKPENRAIRARPP